MSDALDPRTCTRCRREITADDLNRPRRIVSQVFAPASPRPTMPSGTEVVWEIAADYQDELPAEGVHALLCVSCIGELRDWIYQHYRSMVAE